jgi:hypothetical protein
MFLAPGVKKKTGVAGVTMFHSYEAICEQYEQDGETADRTIDRAKAATAGNNTTANGHQQDNRTNTGNNTETEAAAGSGVADEDDDEEAANPNQNEERQPNNNVAAVAQQQQILSHGGRTVMLEHDGQPQSKWRRCQVRRRCRRSIRG